MIFLQFVYAALRRKKKQRSKYTAYVGESVFTLIIECGGAQLDYNAARAYERQQQNSQANKKAGANDTKSHHRTRGN